MAPLSIRNMANVPVELKVIERFEGSTPSKVEEKSKGIFGKATMMFTNSSGPVNQTGPVVQTGAQSFDRQEVSIRVDPFATCQTGIQPTEKGPNEVLRLEFEIDSQRYTTDVPSPDNQSHQLVGLGPDARASFTAVLVPQDSLLAIYQSDNLHAWMRLLKDETPLSGLSMPGTHNSPTHHKALPSVRCQAVSPRKQLENGVRFFDIRLQVESSKLQLVHGVFPISLTGAKYFDELLEDVYAFLRENPSETIVMSAKREGTGKATDQDLAHMLKDRYVGSGADADRWYTDPKIPSLGQVRGKIVLLRRFCIDDGLKGEHDGRGWAIEAESWADNTECDYHGAVCVQDFYEVLETMNIDKKIELAKAHCERAAQCVCPLPGITTDRDNPVPPQPFYLNFLSASNFWNKDCWPEKIAAKLNPALTQYLCTKHAQTGDGDGSAGIVILDWVGEGGNWDIVRCIVGMNAKLMAREHAL